MAEQVPRDGFIHVDALEIIRTPQFQEATSHVNGLIFPFGEGSDVTDQEAAVAQDAIDTLNTKFFGLPWLERAATLIMLAEEDEAEGVQAGVTTIHGKFIGLVPEGYTDNFTVEHSSRGVVVDDMTYEALAVRIDNEDAINTIPLKHIAGLMVELPKRRREDAASILDRLQIDGEVVQHLLGTELFLTSSLADQKLQIDSIISTLNTTTPFLDDDSVYDITVTQPDGTTYELQADNLSLLVPGIDKRKRPYRSIDHFKLGAELWVELLNTEESTTCRIPLSVITDVTPRSEQEDEMSDNNNDENSSETFDVLTNIFDDPDMIDVMAEAENAINSCYDDDERVDVVLEYSSVISDILTEGFYDLSYSVTSMVYREHLDDMITGELECHSDAAAIDIDVKYIDGGWRIVLVMEVDTSEQEVVGGAIQPVRETVYIMPDRAHIITLEGIENPDFDIGEVVDENLTGICESSIEATKQLILSSRFRKAPLERQAHLIQVELEPMQRAIDTISTNEHGDRIVCLVSGYYAIDSSLVGYTCADIAEIPFTQTTEAIPIEGDLISADIPELHEGRLVRFGSSADFPLSKGEPMIILENSETDITYFIPGNALKLMQPFTTS